MSPDFEHAFQMALNLSDHSLALSMLEERCSTDATKYWLELAILALETKHLPLLIRCYKEAKQFDTLLIIYSMTKNYSALRDMAKQESIPVNLKFWAAILSKDRLTVCKALLDAKKYPELALFERTKLETKPELTPTWEKEWLQSIQEKGLKVNPLNNKQYQSDSILEIYQGHDNVSPDSFENHVDLATESFAVYDYQTKRSYGDSTDLISQMERLSTLDFPEEPSISKIEPDISNALNVSAASKSAVIETEILAKKNSLIGHDFDTFQPASRFDAFSSIEAEYPSTSTNQTSAMSPNLMDEEDDWFNGGNPESDQPQVPSNDDSFPDFSEQPSHFTAKPFPNFSPAQNSQSSSILLKPSFPTTQQQPDVFSEKAPISKIVNNQGNPLQVQAPKSPEILTSDSFLQTHHSSAFAFQESIVEDSFMAAPSSDDFVETNQWESSEFASEKPYEFSNSGKLSTLNNEVYSGFTDERRSDINSSIGFKVNSTFEYNTNPPAELNTNKPSSNMNSSQPLGSTGSTQSSGSNYKSAAVNPPALKLGGRPQPSSFPPQAGISNTKAFSKED